MTSASRLEQLQGYLLQDPGNLGLIEEAASVAFEVRDLEAARRFLSRRAELAPLSPELKNLSALIDLAEGRLDAAVSGLSDLLRDHADAAALRFNLAWAQALQGRFDHVVETLDDTTVQQNEAAAALKIEALHHLGLLTEALEAGRRALEAHPGSDRLAGALAAVALDVGDLDAARGLLPAAPGNPAALAVKGALELADHRPAESLRTFDAALERNPRSARARLGRGLALAALERTEAAAEDVAAAAEAFGRHTGSWIAAGWLRFATNDLPGARDAFERALEIDDAFAEAHGGLAVLDLLEGQGESGRRRSQLAQRLDRRSLGALISAAYVKADEGDVETAERLRQVALDTPVGPNGETVAEALIALNLDRRI